jgi:diguanylate cyclase (GGDEF)-like protein/PAS domain S-box-containing protein
MAARRKAPPRAKKASIKRHVGARRGRVLSSLSSDWYWEQDAALRFTRVEVQTGSPSEQELERGVLGKRRWETGIEIEGGWEAHRAVLKARAPFRDVLTWRDFDDGHRRYISVSGEPVFDGKGRFAGYRGVGRDVTEQKRGEQLLKLEHSVALSLADAASEPDALRTALRAICETEGWDYAEFWKLDEAAGVLRRHVHWVMPGVPEAASFAASSPELAVAPGEGLVGTVWKSGEPLWIADTAADPRAMRRSLVAETGLRGTLKVPVSLAGRVVGVINCFCRRIRPPDQRLLQALKVIAAQIGNFLQRAQAEAQVRESEERFRRTFELAGSGVAHVGLDRRFIRVNRRLCEMLGYAEPELIGRTSRELSHPDDLDVINAQRPQLYAGEIDAVRVEKRYLRKDGSTIWVALTVTLERDAAGKPHYEITVYDDIDARKAAESALRESEARFRSLTQMSSDFFWETDAQHRVSQLVHGPNYQPLIGRDAIGKATWELPSVHPDEAGWAAHRAGLDRHEPFRDFEFARVAPDGTIGYFSLSGEPYFAADGGFLGYRGVGRDITGTVLARERIASLAYSDALTGLANRTSLAPALEAAVQRTHRRGSKLAGVFIDLDGFKQINDVHGHDAGDALLVEVARRLRASLRASDPVARLGGDEFFVVLEDLHDNAPAERVAGKLLSAIRRPYELGPGKQAEISASIGISFYPDDAGDAATLMKHADAAMYWAKQAGKNAYRFFKAGAAANDPPAAAGKIL